MKFNNHELYSLISKGKKISYCEQNSLVKGKVSKIQVHEGAIIMDRLDLMKICNQNFKSFVSKYYSVFCNMKFAVCTNNKKNVSVKNRYRIYLQHSLKLST